MGTGWASATGATLLLAAAGSLLASTHAQAADGAVTVSGGFYSPSQVTVGVGDSVTWTWNSDNHSVTFVNGDDTGVRDSGATFTPAPFSSEGTYVYYCTVHGSASSGMRGTVVVRDATPTPTPTATKKPTPSPTPSKTASRSPTARPTSSAPRPTTTTTSAAPVRTSSAPISSSSASATPSSISASPSTSGTPSAPPSEDIASTSASPASESPDSSTVSAADPPADAGRSNTGLLVVAGAALAGAGLLAIRRGQPGL